MTVFVGIVTFNSLADLPACFAALKAQTFPAIRLFVLDNCSVDGSADWVQAHAPDSVLIRNADNVGYGRAHNEILHRIGLQTGDYYLTLNPDAELTPEYVRILVEAMKDHAEIGWGTGKLLMKSSDDQARLVYSVGHGILSSGFAFNIGYGLPDGTQFDTRRPVFGAPGAAALYKAELINKLSEAGAFFDPILFLYAEDTDVDWRSQRLGWQCWVIPEAVAYHRGSSPSGRLKRMAIGNRYLSVLKNASWFDLVTFNLPYLIMHCLARCLVTPRFGIALTLQLLRDAPQMIARRSSPSNRQRIQEWFRWSALQPSMQRPGIQRILSRITLPGQCDRRNRQS